ncbi:MAG: GNAT family N-acetyltransferase [Bacteroidota bacterium]
MNIKLEVFQDQDALDLMEENSLLDAWTRLADINEKHVVLQRWEFVKSWYLHYAEEYQALLFLGHDDEKQILGILPMAIHRKTAKLCVAGDEYAEYHGWLCEEKYEAVFVRACLRYLKKNMRIKKWEINWLAPGTRTDFLDPESLKKEGIYVDITSSEDPIWDLRNTKKFKKINKRANVKRSFRHFRQAGNFFLKRIQGKEELRPLLEELAAQNDFKKEALYNAKGFKGDPKSLDFLEALLQYPELNHFSVLYLDDKPLAFNHALIEGEELCLASTSYNPAESRNSPGKLHLLELAKLCEEEAIWSFDLTPGQDVYKSRFANSSRLVHKVNFYFSFQSKLKAVIANQAKEFIQQIFDRLNLDISSLKYSFNDHSLKVKRMLNLGLLNSLRELGESIYKRKFYRLSKVRNKALDNIVSHLGPHWELSENNFHDLLSYHEPAGYISRKDLFMECLEKFGKGDKLFCLKKTGELCALAWLRKGKYPVPLKGTNLEKKLPDSAHIIYGFREFGKEINEGEIDTFYEEIIGRLIQRGEREIYLLENKEGRCNTSFQTHRNMGLQFDNTYVRILGKFQFSFANPGPQSAPEENSFTPLISI